MRHHRSGKKLGRDSAHRKALYSNLAGALIEHGRIKTTVAKAKAVRPIAEKMITKAKKAQDGEELSVHRIRQIQAFLRDQEMTYKLVHEVAPRYAERNGGYTRILKLGTRDGDNAQMARIELV